MIHSHRHWLATLIATFTVAMLGCAQKKAWMDEARTAYGQGDFATAQTAIEEVANDDSLIGSMNRNDPVELDMAMVELASGNVDAAEQRLRALRDRFDSLPTVPHVQDAVSMAADDRARGYRPAAYEEVLLRTLLAVTSLASDGIDAEAYTLQSVAKANQVGDSVPAITPYLRGVVREATHHDYDDAARAYAQVAATNPAFAPAGDDISRASGGIHSQPGHGVLYVIALAGRGPILESVEAPTTSTALAIASSVWAAERHNVDADDDSSLPASLPNIASVEVPSVFVPPSDLCSVGVTIDDSIFGATQTLTDVSQWAIKQNQAEMPATMARAILRRAAKEAAVTAAAEGLGLEGRQASMFQFAVASAWAGAEQADTRCWSLLPREFQVFRVELPAGEHRLRYSPIANEGIEIGPSKIETVRIEDGRNTYRIVIAPDRQLTVVGRSN